MTTTTTNEIKGPLTIIGLRSENFRGLRAVALVPDPTGVTILTGANGSGKSSILDSIQAAIENLKVAKPIREGEKRAVTVLDLGNPENPGAGPVLHIERRHTPGGSPSLRVYEPGGRDNPLGSPQAILNALAGVLSFDPLHFISMKPREQRETLLELTGLDFTEHDARRAELYDQRADAARDLKTAQARLGDIEQPPSDTPDDEVSSSDLMERIEALRQQVAARERWEQVDIVQAERSVDHARQEVAEADAQIADLEAKLAEWRQAKSDREAKVEAATKARDEVLAAKPADPDLDALAQAKDDLARVEQTNKNVAMKRRWVEQNDAIDVAAKAHAKLEADIRAMDDDKAAQIAAAEYPIDGLAVTDDGVLFENLPLESLSTGEGLEVSAAIGMAMNPTLRVMFIREGSLLDLRHLERVANLADERGYQVWVEYVDPDGEVGILIEDGRVVAIDGQPVAATG